MPDIPKYIIDGIDGMPSPYRDVAFANFAHMTERTLVARLPDPNPKSWPGGKEELAHELVKDMIQESSMRVRL